MECLHEKSVHHVRIISRNACTQTTIYLAARFFSLGAMSMSVLDAVSASNSTYRVFDSKTTNLP